MCYSWLHTCFLYTDGYDHTMGLYIYDDDDDPSILGGCIHTVDFRLSDNPFHSDCCAHIVDLFKWSFLSGWMRPYHGFIYIYIYMTKVSYMYMYMCPWFAALLTVFVLVLTLARRASQSSLPVFPSYFRGNLLHIILSHLLHFHVSYPGVPKPWQLCSVSILICSPNPPWRTN